LGVGDAIAVFDGKGSEWEARIEHADTGRLAVRVGARRTPAAEANVQVTLVQALLKGDKMDRVIRDAVMLGVSTIQPLVTRRTEVPRAALTSGRRQHRWERTIMSSVKQCGRAVVPALQDPRNIDDWLASAKSGVNLMFVEPGAGAGVVELAGMEEEERPRVATVLIGPEGGWDPAEVAAASAAGVTLVTLGSRVLRADAAGAAALAVLRYVWRDL
jgi:16S rRNA (uracil1498-N3)-methyltransferase